MRRIFVSYSIPDAREKAKKKYFETLGLKAKVANVRITDCYTIDATLNQKQLQKAKALLANPLMQTAETELLAPKTFSYVIEIGYLPGVTDNVGHTAKETLTDGAKLKFKPGQSVYSSQVLFISGRLSPSDANKIAYSLHNPLIQRATVKNFKTFQSQQLEATVPKVKMASLNKVTKVDLNVSDEQLIALGKFGIADQNGIRRGPLTLSLEEMKAIKEYFNDQNRQPTDIELETLGQTWSEHCKHTIFSDPMDELEEGIFKTYIKAATIKIRKQKGRKDFCVSVFSDNAGGISFDNNFIVSHKVETHNTPSALDPFGGSITGIVGVNRDALGFGLGSLPIANIYGYCLSDPNDKTKLFRDKSLQRPMLSSRRIMEGVISGINAGGNQSGIPTPLGFTYFDPRFRGKPLVFAGTLGLIPKKIGQKKGWEKAAKPGDLIVSLGGRVGADGIHGATFASEDLSATSPATAVQIGDPITQKKFSDAIAKEARDQNLYNSITDCGAGGLSSAVGEMASSSGGCEVDLDQVPLKYPGLAPWQIWISESQERMVLAVPKNKWSRLEKLMKARGVEATVIGRFNNSAKVKVSFKNKLVLDLDLNFLHNGRPKKQLLTKEASVTSKPQSVTRKTKDFSQETLKLLSNLNITSNEFISTQYDHEVQGSSVIKPLQGRGRINGQASVIRPVLTSKKGLVLSYGLEPQLSELDAYSMAAACIDSAIRAAVASGADIDTMALLDNFCWCSPDDPTRLFQLKEAAKACYDFAVAFGTPYISGKDSMYNDFKGFDSNGKPLKISIPPTLLISAISVIPDVNKAISIDVKMPNDLLYILGETHDELAGSDYLKWAVKDLHASTAGVPMVDAPKNLSLYRKLYGAIQQDLVSSAISLSRGGLVVALSKSLMAGGLGAEVSLKDLPGQWQENYQALFSESAGRILVSIDPKKVQEFEAAMSGNTFKKIGRITKQPLLKISDNSGKVIANIKTSVMLKSYKQTFKDY